jgi:hypothetical protein
MLLKFAVFALDRAEDALDPFDVCLPIYHLARELL